MSEIYTASKEDLEIFNNFIDMVNEPKIETKCYVCGSKTTEVVRLSDEGKITQETTRICENKSCVYFINYKSIKDVWVKVNKK